MKHQAFGTADETLSPDIINWIETRDENDFTAIVLEHRGQKALLLGSTNTKATSIAANFRNWLIRFEEIQSSF